jgi:hypothetical protein
MQYVGEGGLLKIVDAVAATQDPNTGGTFGLVPDSWNSDLVGCQPEFDILAWAAGTVTLTNVELFCGVLRPGTIPNDSFDAVTHASDTVTINAHNLITGDGPFRITSAGGALPAPLAAATDYWPIWASANTIKFATSLENALAGVAIDLTDGGSGNPHQIDGTAATKRMKWLSLGTITASMSLTVHRGHVVRATGHQHAIAYAIGATWGAGIAATFEMLPAQEK